MSKTSGKLYIMCSALILAAMIALAAHGPGEAQAALSGGRTTAPIPFGPGESFDFDLGVRYGIFSAHGDATLRVEGMETVRGAPTYRLMLHYQGKILMFGLNNSDRSWLDVRELFSHRFEQKHDEPGRKRDRRYEFLPEEMRYVNLANPGEAGPLATHLPLDDISFIYYIRTLPLEVGREVVETRYYKAAGNPVTIRVLRTERVTVPAGTFDAIVVRPIIRTDGLFREEGEAEVWLSNDPRRLVLKLRAKAKVGTLTMELKSYSQGDSSQGR